MRIHTVPNSGGYREKPLLISVLSLIYLLNPVGNIVVYSSGRIITDHLETLQWMGSALAGGNSIVWLNLVLWLSAIPLAIGLYKVKMWAWYYYIVHSLLMVIVSMFDADWNLVFSWTTPLTMVFLIPIGLFLTREIRAPYFNPRLKWWKQADRILHAVEVSFDGMQFTSFDISRDGIFLTPVSMIETAGRFDEDMIGHTNTVSLDTGTDRIQLAAHVVRVSPEPHGNYPAGLGLRFLRIDSVNKAKLKELLYRVQQERQSAHR